MNEIISTIGNFELEPRDELTDIGSKPDFQKLKITPAQKIQMGGFIQNAPSLMATDIMSKAYVLKFPEGISGVCKPMQYQTGGIGTPLQGIDGKIVGHASLHSLSVQATFLGIFNILSIASGQYFLAQINKELQVINKSVDKILEFLYSDKKAELISEVSFVKSAYRNYNSIMQHEIQRVATLSNLQEAQKIAIKDAEFYISDLDKIGNAKNGVDIASLVDEAFHIEQCLKLSIQLYFMSSLLEIYYSQNYDAEYISNIEDEAVAYIGKCEKRVLSCFSKLSTHIQNFKESPLKKINKSALEKKVNFEVDQLSKGAESETVQLLRSALHNSTAPTEYYLNHEGDIYIKKP